MVLNDFVIVGAGILGLSIAREIKHRNPAASITILEKEGQLGVHASGRNSGVLHTGIYYPAGTLKARLCKAGADAMFQFACAHDIKVRRDGKVIVAISDADVERLDGLLINAAAGGIRAERADSLAIRAVEPHARAEFGGIICEDTAVIDSTAVLATLRKQLLGQGVSILTGEKVVAVESGARMVRTTTSNFGFGTLINAAGAYADRVARLAGAGMDYQLVPFKGLYYKLAPVAAHRVRASIYPVPDPALPFLGVHFTRVISDNVYIGPTAIPALGRENYGILQGARPREAFSIARQLMLLYVRNPQNFRNLVHKEVPRYRRANFLAAARRLVDHLDDAWIQPSPKVGIRPQLLNTRTGRLEMDFMIEESHHAVHVLNAISPAFTSAFPFAAMVADQLAIN
jgi:(S)-2-hydroxyglutarate dehydrogenase